MLWMLASIWASTRFSSPEMALTSRSIWIWSDSRSVSVRAHEGGLIGGCRFEGELEHVRVGVGRDRALTQHLLRRRLTHPLGCLAGC